MSSMEAEPPLGLGAETARKENGDISSGADSPVFTVHGIHSIATTPQTLIIGFRCSGFPRTLSVI